MLVRTFGYLKLLALAAVLGVLISAAAYGFLALVSRLQSATYTDLPKALGFQGPPPWWPLPLLGVAGLLVGAAVRHLPGTGGHEPTAGLATTGAPSAIELPGVFLAATLLLGADGLTVMPLVIVSVVVAYVLTLRIGPSGAGASAPVVRG
ncbi:hypothetical protein AB0A71_40640 [Kitasatospora aureofaciens]|uniref:hypothetical protein n=1 Tax=Kitasatospora aureofaciens TaxID=1894 RepID=UPI0033F3776E